MAKKPTPKNNQEPDIEDQKDIEALNHKAIEKHKLKKSNGLKYFIMIIFLLLCGGIITLLFSTKISSILPNGMAPVARFLSPSEALAIEKIQIYKLETDQRLNKIESIEHPNVELKIKQLRNEIRNDISIISKELSVLNDLKITESLGDLEKKISNILIQVDDLIFNSSKVVSNNNGSIDKNYDLILKKIRSEVATLSSNQEKLTQRFNKIKNTNLIPAQNNSKHLNYSDDIKEVLEIGGPYTKVLEKISKKGIDIPIVLIANSEGVATINYLKSSFPAAAHASLKLSIKQDVEPGVGGKLLGFLKSQITVRSLDAQKGNSVNAVLSRMQVALNNDDLSEVIDQASLLDEPAKSGIKDWLTLAVNRQTVVDSFSKLLEN
ncbi:MAG: hypothetical protein P8K94_04190 [Amylibacter sp.]|nr:hypothetical protein [Amylibacter sp.]